MALGCLSGAMAIPSRRPAAEQQRDNGECGGYAAHG